MNRDRRAALCASPEMGQKKLPKAADQMSRSIVLEELRWALNTSWTDPLRRTAANHDYGVAIECQLAGIHPSYKRPLCYRKP